jgi:hypothetical protein
MKGLILMASSLFVSSAGIPTIQFPATETIMVITETGDITIPMSRDRLEQIVGQQTDDYSGQRAYAHLALEILRLRGKCGEATR